MSQATPPEDRAAYPAAPQMAADPDYRLLDLGKYIRLFWKRRYFLMAWAFGGAILAFGIARIMHPQYDATVRLMPPARKESILLSLSPSRNDGDLYLGLAGSRTVTDDIIQTLNLREYFHTDKPSELRRDLAAMAKITVDKDQFVSVTVRAKEPEMAVKIANAYPEALSRLNRTIALSQAAHRWEYFEGPLEQEKNKLADAEEQLKQAQQKTGMVLPEAQVQLGLNAIAQLKSQITGLNEQLAALMTGSTDQNPQVVQLKSQIASLNGQLARLQAQNGGSGTKTSSAEMPGLTLEIERKAREVRFHEALFEVLSKQYENARIDESYSPPVELVDAAVLADEKSFPPRRKFALGGFVIGGILGMLLVYLPTLDLRRRFRQLVADDNAASPHPSGG